MQSLLADVYFVFIIVYYCQLGRFRFQSHCNCAIQPINSLIAYLYKPWATAVHVNTPGFSLLCPVSGFPASPSSFFCYLSSIAVPHALPLPRFSPYPVLQEQTDLPGSFASRFHTSSPATHHQHHCCHCASEQQNHHHLGFFNRSPPSSLCLPALFLNPGTSQRKQRHSNNGYHRQAEV